MDIFVDEVGRAIAVGNGYALRTYETLDHLLGTIGLDTADLEEISLHHSRRVTT